MRFTFTLETRNEYFKKIKEKSDLSWDKISTQANIEKRTLYAWRHGVTSIPESFTILILEKLSIPSPTPLKVIDEVEMKRKSGILGGIERNRLYGNPGTKEGRKLGGLKSLQTHYLMHNSPFVERKVELPLYSEELAEFVGIILGDGGVSRRQITITLNKEDDSEYIHYVVYLIERLFKLKASISPRSDSKATVIIVSRSALVKFLGTMEIYPRNKVLYQIAVPRWIWTQKEFKKKCIRGLLDTDGCFYIDKHTIKEKIYRNAGMNFSNRSLPILKFINETLLELGLSPTSSTPHSICLRRKDDIMRYFSEIGSSNPKHIVKFNAYIEENGRVPKRS